MPAGQSPITQDPNVVQDGRTTRQRRLRPVVMVNTGEGKGKTTAAMGTALRAWNHGWDVGVFQFVKSGRWHVGEQDALQALGSLHDGCAGCRAASSQPHTSARGTPSANLLTRPGPNTDPGLSRAGGGSGTACGRNERRSRW